LNICSYSWCAVEPDESDLVQYGGDAKNAHGEHSRSQDPLIAIGRQAAKGESFVIAKAGKPMVTRAHAIATERLPAIHKDPFDRILIAQAESEGLTLPSSDAVLPRYGDLVRPV
jgi:hypothetical protein